MSAKKPKRNPSELSIDKFFGPWADLIRESHAAETAVEEIRALQNRSRTAADLATNFLRDPRQVKHEPTSNAFSEHFDPELWDTVENWWPFQILAMASETDDAEGYKRLLSYVLLRLGVPAPKGVLTPFRWPHGRPKETKTEAICAAWEADGRPEPNIQVLNKLGKAFYPDEFIKVRSRKPVRDRVFATLLRHRAKTAIKSPSIS